NGIRDHTVKDHPSRTRQSPIPNNHRLQRIGLSSQRRTPTPLMEPVPLYRGMRKVADSSYESTEISRTFDISKTNSQSLSSPATYDWRSGTGIDRFAKFRFTFMKLP